MNKILTNIALIVLGTSFLFGCSTNTKNENTGVGAVSGAAIGGVATGLLGGNPVAIGIGAIGGAVVGGLIGHSMPSSDDQAHMTSAMNNTTNKPMVWENTKTGKRYSVVPTSDWITINGNSHCRHYQATTVRHGKTKVSNGTACLGKNGSWYDAK